MTKQNKMYLGIGLVAVAGYFIYTSGKKNAGGFRKKNPNCQTVDGNVGFPIGTKVQTKEGIKYITATGSGQTTLCFKNSFWS